MALITCPDCRKPVSDAAPVCPHCGRPMMSQLPGHPTPVSATRPPAGRSFLGPFFLTIVLIVFLSFCGIVCYSAKHPRPATTTTVPIENKQPSADINEKVKFLTSNGVVKKINCSLHTAYVDPFYWNNVPVDTKRGMTITLAKYCGGARDGFIEIYDNMSGKRLAKYGVWGFEVE